MDPRRNGRRVPQGVRLAVSFLRELWAYMGARKKFWLLPLMLVLLVFGGLIVLAKGSAIAPFIYTIF